MIWAICDIETRIDKAGIRAVYDKSPISADEPAEVREAAEDLAVKMLLDSMTLKGGIQADFVPLPFHIPISIAIGRVAADYTLGAVYTVEGDEREIVRVWWEKVGIFLGKGGVIVTFNGRRFDMAVLELAALRYGIPISAAWFEEKYGARYRFQDNRHYDLADFLDNHGAVRLYGGLDGLLKICGLPGKAGIDGSMVQGMWERNEDEAIHQYCREDVSARTYPLFLRTELIRGRLKPERYAELIAPPQPSLPLGEPPTTDGPEPSTGEAQS